jgi:predicted MPP superfamily phosphohydrolase
MRLFFFAPVFLLYTGFCVYIGVRLMGFFRFLLPNMNAVLFWILFLLVCGGLMFAGFYNRNIFLLRKAGSYWIAFFMYLMLLLACSDVLRLGLFIIKKPIPHFQFYSVAASLVLCVLLLIYGTVHARTLQTVNYTVTIPGNGGDLRIILVSDLHIGATDRAWVGRTVDRVNSLKPDLVCIAGDVFDGNVSKVPDLPGITDEFRRIRAPLGVYACAGNHDVDRMMSGGTQRIAEILQSADIVFLQDETSVIRDGLYIVGRKDARPISFDANGRKSAEELCAELDGTIILMDHQPTEYAQIEQAGVSLVFSGHTHAGQIFPANLIAKGMYQKAGAVHYGSWRGATLQGIVTSGAGFWGPPLRIASNSEVVVIDVRFVQ